MYVGGPSPVYLPSSRPVLSRGLMEVSLAESANDRPGPHDRGIGKWV
uniref:Uncharacterized protein n=1 Tax=Picea glauca TaxID=3330 RepID=A0A101LUJ3_PICGL|nr:hypothetical protein ABT39_MTgene2450 [Picea glauca]QHR88519.1 hypothetical protein Q903MT_gene2533 [Picea sitchensis]